MDARSFVEEGTYIAEEIARYERAIVNQARRINSGESNKRPDKEHLRVLINWLDGDKTTGSRS